MSKQSGDLKPRLQRPSIDVPELRKDPVTGRWVIISTERRKRPNDFRFEPARRCSAATSSVRSAGARGPDAAGSVSPIRSTAARRNGPGWDLRVVPNKFPALQVEGDARPRRARACSTG